MSGSHQDIGPELQKLAQAILDQLDPAVRLAAARLSAGGEGKCQQVWCPVCALAALVNGEQHPMLSVIAEHSVALLAVVRAMAENGGTTGSSGTPEPPTTPDGPPDEPPPSGPGRYQPIPVTVEE